MLCHFLLCSSKNRSNPSYPSSQEVEVDKDVASTLGQNELPQDLNNPLLRLDVLRVPDVVLLGVDELEDGQDEDMHREEFKQGLKSSS